MLFCAIRCVSVDGEKAKTETKQVVINNVKGVKYHIDKSISEIEWSGAKANKQHKGTIELKDGYLLVDTLNNIVGGNFVIDMRSIDDADLVDKNANKKLVSQLQSSDFFCVDSFPTAKFEITKVVKDKKNYLYDIFGNLTLKNVTKSISFKASIKFDNFAITAESRNFIINRTEWNIRYGSKRFFDNLQDDFINDEIGLKVKLLVKK